MAYYPLTESSGGVAGDASLTNNNGAISNTGVNTAGLAGPLGGGNGWYGVYIAGGAASNTIGGSSSVSGGKLSGAGNVISGNVEAGVGIQNASGNAVQGNFIGTDVTGTVGIGNNPLHTQFDDVDLLDGATNNTIGGVSSVDAHGNLSGFGNLISDSGADGVFLSDFFTAGNPVTGNLVQGNFIGTDVKGTTALGNTGNAVQIALGASQNTIGGTADVSTSAPFTGNVISASTAGDTVEPNRGYGVLISNDYGSGSATGNVVEGNNIGTDVHGTAALGNVADGVLMQTGTSGNTIGGSVSGAGNLISGNSTNGIEISASNNNVVAGNTIGLDASGTLWRCPTAKAAW